MDRDNIFINVPQKEILTEEFEEYMLDVLLETLEGNDEHEVFLIQPSINAPIIFVKNRKTQRVKLIQLNLNF